MVHEYRIGEDICSAVERTRIIEAGGQVVDIGECWRITALPPSAQVAQPIPMRLTCPDCRALHIDEGEFATKPHHTHSCQECGLTWRPAVVHTVGVRFLPGFKTVSDTKP